MYLRIGWLVCITLLVYLASTSVGKWDRRHVRLDAEAHRSHVPRTVLGLQTRTAAYGSAKAQPANLGRSGHQSDDG